MSKKRRPDRIIERVTETQLAIRDTETPEPPNPSEWDDSQLRMWTVDRLMNLFGKHEELFTRADEIAAYIKTGNHPTRNNDGENRTDS